ncbi:hypothetical protein DOT_0649 [Desulfosporosinus sp. OT]|nr:hypothetical protein DOT_0649 [Desulfosporosinus sp. OT]
MFFAPGNHDIDKSADDEIIENGLNMKLSSIEKVNDHIDSGKMLGIARIVPFKDFERAYYSKYLSNKDITVYNSTFKIALKGFSIGVTCFNSVWRCFDSTKDKGKIILGERQITRARPIIEGTDIKIGLIHHPLDWFSPFELTTISSLIQKDYDLLFCGHNHRGSSWTQTSMQGKLFLSMAPANWSCDFRFNNGIYSNGYSIIDIDNNLITVNHRRYSHNKESYDPNTDLGNDQGVMTFEIPSKDQLAKTAFTTELVTKIQDNYFDILNEHLISSTTNTNAPKILSEMFVLPKIVDNPMEEKSKQITYKLNDFCSSDESFLILGTKEAGKTVLLDRMLIELTLNIIQYRKIPVYFDCDSFSHSRIETGIALFLGIPITAVSEFLHSNKLCILVDNIDRASKSFLIQLQKFLEDYNLVQIIATSSYVIEGKLIPELLDYPFLAKFKYAYIREFSAGHIRQLMNKWFNGNKDYDNKEKLEKLLRFFMTLNIPRTPLAVSMFLWIFEQQGKNYKPINNATMVQNFIETLLDKLSSKEILSETFDFTNKERLLAKIAYNMFQKNEKDYSLSYDELSGLIFESIKKKKFGSIVKGEEVLFDFLKKGIFLVFVHKGQRFIRFRFNCFFKYFLMKNIDYEPGFKEFVLEDCNYLNFGDELDYYTGLKRDQAEILQLLVKRAHNKFSEIISKIEALEYSFDTFFETRSSIASSLDRGFIKKLTERKKPTNEDLDKMHDEMLESVDHETGIEKKEKMTPLQELETAWIIAAKVLKNTEETEIENLKSSAFNDILKCAMGFGVIYKTLLEDYLQKNDTNNQTLRVFCNFFPLGLQQATVMFMGTAKLLVVIQEKMAIELENKGVTDLEKILIVSMYSDLKGEDYFSSLRSLTKNIRRNYSRDIVLLKLLAYYYLRSESEYSDKIFEDIMTSLILDTKKSNIEPQYVIKNRNRSKIIEDYRLKRDTFQQELKEESV